MVAPASRRSKDIPYDATKRYAQNSRFGSNALPSKDNEPWRRVSGMTREFESSLDAGERHSHIARLAQWIESRVKNGPGSGNRRLGIGSTNNELCATGGLPASAGERGALTSTRHSLRSSPPSPQRGEGMSPGGPPEGRAPSGARGNDQRASFANDVSVVPAITVHDSRFPAADSRFPIGCTTDWLPRLEAWSRVAHAGLTVERLCRELNITHAKLTRLLREYCGLSASEFLDGLKLRKLKHELLPQLRLAAKILWGKPGYQSELLAAAMHDTSKWQPSWACAPLARAARAANGDAGETPALRYAPADSREMRELRTNTKARAAALLEVLHELRVGLREDEASNFAAMSAWQDAFNAGAMSVGGSAAVVFPLPSGERADVSGFSRERGVRGDALDSPNGLSFTAPSVVQSFALQSLALKLGFESPGKMKQACINVFGRSLIQIERTLAEEITRYYIAAEDRVLRELASREGNTAFIARARYHYHGDDERPPQEPWLDAWSAAEAFQKEWLESMTALFG